MFPLSRPAAAAGAAAAAVLGVIEATTSAGSVLDPSPSLAIQAGAFEMPRPLPTTPKSFGTAGSCGGVFPVSAHVPPASPIIDETSDFASSIACSFSLVAISPPAKASSTLPAETEPEGSKASAEVIQAGSNKPRPRPRLESGPAEDGGAVAPVECEAWAPPPSFEASLARAFSFSSSFQRSKASFSSLMAANRTASFSCSSAILLSSASLRTRATSSSFGNSSRAVLRIESPPSSSSSQASSATIRAFRRASASLPFSAVRSAPMALERSNNLFHRATTSLSLKSRRTNLSNDVLLSR
mmetsp:Transcript_24343/g.50197  ORF Transcript_24343/g.50197 Transcript_24343/m.50197 type:complete len:299 (+) Transcript_24343:609-1505(+)